jgi:hypothetical protein
VLQDQANDNDLWKFEHDEGLIDARINDVQAQIRSLQDREDKLKSFTKNSQAREARLAAVQEKVIPFIGRNRGVQEGH